VALTESIPAAIAPLLAEDRQPVPIERARTAVSIRSPTPNAVSRRNFLRQFPDQTGGRGIAARIAEAGEFRDAVAGAGFMQWLKQAGDVPVSDEDRALLAHLDEPDWFDNAELAPQLRIVLEPLAAHYFLKRHLKGPVDRFRWRDSISGNGARLERIDWLGDLSLKGLRESAGIMVNYLYRLEDIEKNHEAYANQGEIRRIKCREETAEDRRPSLLDMRLS